MNLENVTHEDRVVGGLAIALAIFLLILPWWDLPFIGSLSATDSPDAIWGVLAFLAAIAVVADLALERFSPQTQIPALNSRAHTRFVLACVVALFVVIKFISDIHFSDFGWGFYVDIIATAALVYFALQVRNGVALPGAGSGGSRLGGRRSAGAVNDPPPAPVGTPPVGGPGGPPAAPGV